MVKRYINLLGLHCECEFEERENGEWVRYEDLLEIVRDLSDSNKKELKENKELKNEIERINQEWKEYEESIKYIRIENKRLRELFEIAPTHIRRKLNKEEKENE